MGSGVEGGESGGGGGVSADRVSHVNEPLCEDQFSFKLYVKYFNYGVEKLWLTLSDLRAE